MILLSSVSEIFETLLVKGPWKCFNLMELYQIISLASERGTQQQNNHMDLYKG
jgi:hypothetical protein